MHHPATRMNNSAWRRARRVAAAQYARDHGRVASAGFVRVHDLRHTVGCRLRAAGGGEEDRADILGHHRKGRSITTHYSAAELGQLLERLEQIAEGPESRGSPAETVLRVV